MSLDTAPYPGLRPYREEEQHKFFGRTTDKAILVDKIVGNRLTLLFAASGVGKSSLLQAAVIPHLKAINGENLTVVCNTDWVIDPLVRVRDVVLLALRAEPSLSVGVEPDNDSLVAALELGSLLVRRTPLVLILDQFEEFFRYQRHSTSFAAFIEQLSTVINDTTLPVSVVLSMREDFALELNAFKPALPNLLFENYYRLEKLTRQAALQAIVDPVRQVGCEYEPALLKQLLQDLQDHQREPTHLSHVISPDSVDSVDPPYLQIVCAYLWRLKPAGETTLRLASYAQAGGIEGILRYFLDDALSHLSNAEKQLASKAFDYLAAQRGMKMAYPLNVLARILRVKPTKLDKVLAKLAKREMNILRDQTRHGVVWYELYHDMFSDSIDKWNNRWKKRQFIKNFLLSTLSLVFFLGFVFLSVDSLVWSAKNGFPMAYTFKKFEFRLMSLGLLPEPLPEMVEIKVNGKEFKVGEQKQSIIDELTKNQTFSMENFGVPSTTARLDKPFAMGKYEITYEQYDYYVWQQRKAGKDEKELIYPTGATRDNGRGLRAVTQVSWNEANAYTKWLSDKTGQEYRLPTEVEWEYAARAGTTTSYWWGDEVGTNKANCSGCGSQWDNLLVAPVGQFEANKFGLYDTAGNVWELTCSEWQKQFDGSEGKCVTDTSGGRVIRGGSWYFLTDWVRSSARSWSITDDRSNDVGFRVLRFSRQDKDK